MESIERKSRVRLWFEKSRYSILFILWGGVLIVFIADIALTEIGVSNNPNRFYILLGLMTFIQLCLLALVCLEMKETLTGRRIILRVSRLSSRIWNILKQRKHKIVLGVISLLAVFIAVLFGWNESYEWDARVATEVFGNYGDFLGGILSVVSVYFLVETLREQRAHSRESRFNDLFFGLLQHLQKEVEWLRSTRRGPFQKEPVTFENREYFQNLSLILESKYNSQYSDDDDYIKQSIQVISEYRSIYLKNPRLSSYFRLLYRICELTDKSELEDPEKKEYIKILRAQLTPGELLLLRYNAQIDEGKNFQNYIIKYNLLKHLFVSDVLEFKRWWLELDDEAHTCVRVWAEELKSVVRSYVREGVYLSRYIPLEPIGWQLKLSWVSRSYDKIQVTLLVRENLLHGLILGNSLVNRKPLFLYSLLENFSFPIIDRDELSFRLELDKVQYIIIPIISQFETE